MERLDRFVQDHPEVKDPLTIEVEDQDVQNLKETAEREKKAAENPPQVFVKEPATGKAKPKEVFSE